MGRPASFDTLEREKRFRKPSSAGPDHAVLTELVAPHIESFNALFDDSGLPVGDGDGSGFLSAGLKEIGDKAMFDRMGTVGAGEGKGGWGNKLVLRIDSVSIGKPMVSERAKGIDMSGNTRIYPAEARERLTSYRGRMTAKLSWSLNGGPEHSMMRDCGLVPIMVRSVRCHLRDASSDELVRRHEEAEEFGGYFIINGNERIVRYLILPRRNHVISLVRPSFQNRGASYTEYAVQIRCVRSGDQSSLTNTLHYLSNGSAMLRFSWRKNEYVVPIMLLIKAAVGASDKEIFEGVIMKDYDNTYLTDRVELLLRSFKTYSLFTREQCLEYLGNKFRVVLGLREDMTNADVGSWLLNKVLLVHLPDLREKSRMLLFMLRKLYSLVSGACAVDNPDSPQHQEVLLPGALYGMIVKERLEEALNAIRGLIMMDVRNGAPNVDFHDEKYLLKIMQKVNFDVGARLSNFMATGNLVSPSGLDLQQASGFTIVAEKLNWHRYISHFRCIHRGAFFAELKTTTVRKLLPESWGTFSDDRACRYACIIDFVCLPIRRARPSPRLVNALLPSRNAES
ncbi:putative RPA135-DNA-directed RNA polymerase I, 135 kd subunit [Exidia glandulosa HHB12029]|uniref:DNA-directed RNA polymerase n=1 Tax=Exidia glandulosa HHB12029 TaxID=1314781 RepID=A0A165ASJ0_EXIGL|nr:putative RPA135-DNA-directed RNA polymerase I, 135 kd subunit [Exidia glandulosa HHB12029]